MVENRTLKIISVDFMSIERLMTFSIPPCCEDSEMFLSLTTRTVFQILEKNNTLLGDFVEMTNTWSELESLIAGISI